MARELLVSRATGQTVYAVGRVPQGESVGLWANPTTPGVEAFDVANWAQYAIAMTELGDTGLYEGDFPRTSIDPSQNIISLEVIYFQQVGASPVETDTKITGVLYTHPDDWQAGEQLNL